MIHGPPQPPVLGLFDVDEPFEAAKSKALRMLNFSPLSSWEVRQRLQERHLMPEDLTERIAEWLIRTVRQRGQMRGRALLHCLDALRV